MVSDNKDCIPTYRFPSCSVGKNFQRGLQWRWGSRPGENIQSIIVGNILRSFYIKEDEE